MHFPKDPSSREEKPDVRVSLCVLLGLLAISESIRYAKH
jgi:hypothetical protein